MKQQQKATKTFYFLGLLFVFLVFQHCKTKQSTTIAVAKTSENTVTYTKDIAPVMEQKCSPCHYPESGKKKFLDTYKATKNNIDDILNRVQLPTTDKYFMPFKSKKEPLTEEEIKLLKDWVTQGMPE